MTATAVELKTLKELRPEIEAGMEVQCEGAPLSYFKHDGVYYEVNMTRAYPCGNGVDGEWVNDTAFTPADEEPEDAEPMWFVSGPADMAYASCRALGMFAWWES